MLGAHVNATLNGLDGLLAQWRPPLVVALDHSDVWHRLKAASPDTVLVGRLVQPSEPNFNDPGLHPVQAARDHCDKVLPFARRMGSTYTFWQGVNEPVVQSAEAMKRLSGFEAERVRIMAGQGFRVVVGSFSVGNPANMAWWQQFLPALEAARQHRGALALHEYAWPTLQQDAPWYLLRHRKVYHGEPKEHWSGLPPHLRELPLLITECGLDGLIERGDAPRGWMALYGQDPNAYLRQLAWYDAQLAQDRYVMGAALYCCCPADDPHWASYNVWPELAQTIARQSRPLYRLDRPGAPAGKQSARPPAPASEEAAPKPATSRSPTGPSGLGAVPPASLPSAGSAPDTQPRHGLLPAANALRPAQIPLSGELEPVQRLDETSSVSTAGAWPAAFTTSQGRMPVENPRVLDQTGQEMDWDWLVAQFGAVTVQRTEAPTGVQQVYRLVRLQAIEGPAALVAHVVDAEGEPMEGVMVVRHWPGAPELPMWPAPTSRWHDRGVLGRTDVRGNLGFGMGVGDYYAPPKGGQSSVWLAGTARPSDLVGGLGMVQGTNHRHLDLVWQLDAVAESLPASEPAPTPVVPTPPAAPTPPTAPPSLTPQQWSALLERLDHLLEALESKLAGPPSS